MYHLQVYAMKRQEINQPVSTIFVGGKRSCRAPFWILNISLKKYIITSMKFWDEVLSLFPEEDFYNGFHISDYIRTTIFLVL